MRRLALVIVLVSVLLLTACSANDPLTEDLYTDSSYIRIATDGTGGYWHEYLMDGIELSPGTSDATQIVPNASSLGGYRLDAINEVLYFGAHVDDDWDGTSDGVFEVYFEVNEDNTLGLVTDTVKFQLEVWHKLPNELVNTVFSLNGSTVVGQSNQHELFNQHIVIGNLRAGEVVEFRLNLNTVLGEVVNVIVNYVEFKYPAYYPGIER